MFDCKYLIFLSVILYHFHLISSCGCYGSNSCTPNAILCDYYHEATDSCLCDCCPACNTCEQLLQSNCFAHQYKKHYSLSPNQSTIIAKINESIVPTYIIDQTNGEIVRYLWDPCLRRSLPKDIYLTDDPDGSYRLIGTPKEKLNETLFEILFKGPVNLLISINFTISII
jgi:hypothetical protein